MAELAEKTQVDYVIKPIIRRLKLIGFDLENFNIWSKIWWFYAVSLNITWTILSCFSLMGTINVDVICDVVLNVTSVVQAASGVLIVHAYRNVFLETVDIMQKHFWFHENDFDEKLITKHKFNYRMLSNVGMSYMVVGAVCFTFWFLEPVVNSTGKFPMDMMFPYRNFIKESPYYQIIYMNQLITVFLGASCVILIDLLFASSLGFVIMQVDLIKEKLKKLMSRNDDEKEIYEKLKECIIHHNIILNALEKIAESYSYYMLTKLLADMLGTCVTTYLFSQQQSLNFKFILILANTLGQPLLFSFFGDFATRVCASIGEEAYEVNWQNTGYKSVTTALSMMILRSQKPVLLTAGGMVIISLPNYVAFMRMIFSFFLVLKRENNT